MAPGQHYPSIFVFERRVDCRLFEETAEDQPPAFGRPPVEPEDKLVEVELGEPAIRGSLVGSNKVMMPIRWNFGPRVRARV